ncbi:MAG: BREX-1 system phosphatase PglZ type A, partial [Deltaproteobacteria bacterium]|nr:BREX-1 system phosphatase PglZ type A [Deltaproteobacteria bacterium]
DKQELRDDFAALELAGVEKIELDNNEFAVKYRILRREPEQKFLLYREGAQPEDLDNWLLDVQLAEGEFHTEQAAIWLAELRLGPEFIDLVRDHPGFFNAVKRREALRKRLDDSDGSSQLRLKMLAVCSGAEGGLDSVLENLLQELAEEREEKLRLIERCRLDAFLWEQLRRVYGYDSTEPGIRDFVIELFKSVYAMGTDGQVKMTADALVFMRRWQDSRQYEESFETLADDCAAVLAIENDLGRRDFRSLLEVDYFRLIDQKIISDLVAVAGDRTASVAEITGWVRQRRQSHWYRHYQHLYEAVVYAARFSDDLSRVELNISDLADGIQRYSKHWYRLDQLYRKFVYHVRKAGQPSLTTALAGRIDNLYSNNFLLKLGDRFQALVDKTETWKAFPLRRQDSFFSHWVKPFLDKDNKVCVIIADALRYEIGEELLGLIRREDRFQAELEPALAMLPSYTQLGMAALLPGEKLTLAGDESGTVLVDGQDSRGLANRAKILSRGGRLRATACKADELMALKGEDCRALVRDHDVIYIYHNLIDATGDKLQSEDRVFEVVEETLVELIKLIKKLTGANASNLLITADHGFIYQNRAIEESDFSNDEIGGQVLLRARRFVMGSGLVDAPGLGKFTPAMLGLDGGEIEIQILKSINRLRLKGSGSRFVHGGASLQEIVVPVLKINKKRQSDMSRVEVEILRGGNSVITSGQLVVTLYQSLPASDKVRPRKLRIGIYNEAGDLISDSFELTFDQTSENPRERETKMRLMLAREADAANGCEVVLKLEEKLTGTSHYQTYSSLRYLLRRSFTSDFDM